MYSSPVKQALATSGWSKVQRPSTQVLVAYGVTLGFAGAVYHFVAEGRFSVITTVAEMVQCLAIALLGLQSVASGSAAGISARSLGLEALALCCRLICTVRFNGYLPVDASGDWIFQTVDLCALGLVVALLYHVLQAQRGTYQAEEDTLPLTPLIVACFLAAALLHADMNKRPVFDTLWMSGLFLGVVAVLPQLWLITRTGGRVEALTSHYIALMAVSRILNGCFMWAARFDMKCKPWVGEFNHAIWAILAAHAVHLLLLADFGYHYVRSVARAGLACVVDVEVV